MNKTFPNCSLPYIHSTPRQFTFSLFCQPFLSSFIHVKEHNGTIYFLNLLAIISRVGSGFLILEICGNGNGELVNMIKIHVAKNPTFFIIQVCLLLEVDFFCLLLPYLCKRKSCILYLSCCCTVHYNHYTYMFSYRKKQTSLINVISAFKWKRCYSPTL